MSLSSIKGDVLLSLSNRFLVILRTHLWLIVLGICSELFYLFYLLHDFPITRYYPTLTDMGIINSFSHTGFLKFLICFSILFALFGLAWYRARRRSDLTTLRIILIFGSLFAATSIFVYPVTAIDVYIYIVHSLVIIQHHANPIITTPAHFASQDPLMNLAGGFVTQASPYGPLALIIQALPVFFAGRDVLVALLLTKWLCSTLLLVTAYVVYKILSRIAPQYALAGALALAWNPFALFEYSVNSHNDIIMMFFVVLSVYALTRERYTIALTLIVASSLIKFASLPLVPLFLLYGLWHQPTWKKRLQYIGTLSIPLLLALVCFLPFWAGPKTFTYLLDTIQGNLYSFRMFVSDFFGGKVTSDQAKFFGQALFGACFLYGLWKARGDLRSMLQGGFTVMFALLAFGATYIQVWYLIWPFVMALFVPDKRTWLAAFILVYDATFVELVHAYIWPWGGYMNPATFAIVNSVVYLALFVPPLLLLLSTQLAFLEHRLMQKKSLR